MGIEIYDFTHIQILSVYLPIYTVQRMNEGGHQGFFKSCLNRIKYLDCKFNKKKIGHMIVNVLK